MKTLYKTVVDIKRHLLASDGADTAGVILVHDDIDSYGWRPILDEDEGMGIEEPNAIYIPFKSQHRVILSRVDPRDQEYLIMSLIADIALTLLVEDRKAALALLKKYREEAKKPRHKNEG